MCSSVYMIFMNNLCLGFLRNLLLQESSKVRLIICYICKDKKIEPEQAALVLQASAKWLNKQARFKPYNHISLVWLKNDYTSGIQMVDRLGSIRT